MLIGRTSPEFIPLFEYSGAVTSGYHNECEKTDQLHAKEGKSNRHERIGLHMGYVNQRLAHASDQDDYGQVVHCKAVDTKG
jgi:hypothetical protein